MRIRLKTFDIQNCIKTNEQQTNARGMIQLLTASQKLFSFIYLSLLITFESAAQVRVL